MLCKEVWFCATAKRIDLGQPGHGAQADLGRNILSLETFCMPKNRLHLSFSLLFY